jgi:hypothetical protein
MGKLNDDEKSLLDKLLKKQDEPDDDDFEVELWNGDKGAKLPFSKARKFLSDAFGVDLGEPPDAGEAEGDGKDKTADDDGKVTRFGRRVS